MFTMKPNRDMHLIFHNDVCIFGFLIFFSILFRLCFFTFRSFFIFSITIINILILNLLGLMGIVVVKVLFNYNVHLLAVNLIVPNWLVSQIQHHPSAHFCNQQRDTKTQDRYNLQRLRKIYIYFQFHTRVTEKQDLIFQI